jgi:MoxR-like ATPase
VLVHRLILRPDAELNQVRTADILDEVLAATPAPRTSASRV